MSEVETLLRLYGALDRAVVEQEVDPKTIAPLLGAYRHPEAVGWYDNQYVPWIEGAAARAERRGDAKHRREPKRTEHRSRTDKPSDLSPRAQEIKEAMAGFSPEVLEGRKATRRLLAVTVIARALPHVFGPKGSHAHVAHGALTMRFPGEVADEEAQTKRAQHLHTHLATQFTAMDQWGSVVGDAVGQRVLPESLLSHDAAPPCTGHLIMRPTSAGGDPDPCLVMEAEFTTDKFTFDEAKAYLRPTNWKYDGSLWCRMEEYDWPAPNTALYHETVSTDCSSSTPLWTVSTDLQFWFSHPAPNEARAEYDFVPGLPIAGSDIEVDEGSLRIIELPDGSVNVKTTKRVRFAGNFDGPGLAMFMCATGYSTALEDVVFTVSESGTPDPFPVPAPQGGTMSPPQKTKSTTGDDTFETLVAEATAFADSQLKEVAATCTASLTKVQAGTYSVEHAWSDGLKLWSSWVTGMGKALDLGTRAAKVVAQQSADET